MALLALVIFSCASPVSVPPVASPAEPTKTDALILVVPADCPHLIVDILSRETSDITIACFNGSSMRTFLDRQTGPPLGTFAADPNGRVSVEYGVPVVRLPVSAR